MTLLDASGLVDLVIEGPTASRVEALLREEENVWIPTPNLAEVVDVLARRFGLAEEEQRRALEPLLDSVLKPYMPDATDAWRAGAIRAGHYGTNRAISICDAILVGCAAGHAGPVASGDRLLLAIATAEGIEAIDLN